MDLLEILQSQFPSASPTSNGVKISCPNHKNHSNGQDANPSCHIFMSYFGKYIYYCYSCGAKGLLSDLLGGNYNLPEHAPFKPSILGLNTYDREEIYGCTLPIGEVPEALEYCRNRGVSDLTLYKLGVRASVSNKLDLKKIFVLSYLGDNIVGINYRNYHDDESSFYPSKGTVASTNKAFLIGQSYFVEGKPCLIVEGLFDYLVAVENGLDEVYNVMALGGASIRAAAVESLLGMGVTDITFWTDNDLAGNKILFDNKVAMGIEAFKGHRNYLNSKSNKKPLNLKKSFKDYFCKKTKIKVVDYGYFLHLGLTGKDPSDIINNIVKECPDMLMEHLQKSLFEEIYT